MSLFEKLNSDLKAAMKGGNKERVEVLRFLLAGLQAAQKEKSMKEPGAALTDEEVISNLQKEAKRRKEAIDLFDASLDRKSTRLNSSHQIISYAVFCLKKKKYEHPIL